MKILIQSTKRFGFWALISGLLLAPQQNTNSAFFTLDVENYFAILEIIAKFSNLVDEKLDISLCYNKPNSVNLIKFAAGCCFIIVAH